MLNQRYRTTQFCKMFLDSWFLPLHRETGRMQLSFSLQQLCCSIIVSATFLDVAEVFSLLKMKLNVKICTRRKLLLIIFLKADCSNKNYEKKLWKIHVKQFIFRCFNSRACNFTEKWTSSQMILKNAYFKGHLLVTASKWRWFYDFQALWEIVKTWSLQVLCKI